MLNTYKILAKVTLKESFDFESIDKQNKSIKQQRCNGRLSYIAY